MADPDLDFVLMQFAALQRELRQGFAVMRLRDEQREATHQSLIQTLTLQMASTINQVEDLLAESEKRQRAALAELLAESETRQREAFESRLDKIESRLDQIKKSLER